MSVCIMIRGYGVYGLGVAWASAKQVGVGEALIEGGRRGACMFA